MCIRDRCKTLAHSGLSPFASTNDLIALETFLPFTTFLLHFASSVPFSSNIYTKYLNPDTCSSCSPSNITSQRGLSSLTTITLLLSTFTFKPLLLHTLPCLLYTSDAADERSSVDLGGRRIIKKKKK